MEGFKSLIFLQLVCHITCMDQLQIAFEWKQLDYEFPTPDARQQALESTTFISENNIPVGLEVYKDKLFITVPRWKKGVPSSLNYIDLKGNVTTSPKLMPYPNWASHSTGFDNQQPDIVSALKIRADRCKRLWVLDEGKIGKLEKNSTNYSPALIIYDLDTDNLIRKYNFPEDFVKEDSSFANIAVEDSDCANTFAYAADVGKAAIVVYSWDKNESWRVNHHYFHPDPMACDYSVKGVNYTSTDGVYGLGLTSQNADNFSTLFFHPISSYNEFSVSTRYLQNLTLAKENFFAFKLLGNRGPNAQSSASFIDPKTGVLFYSLVNLNAVACWRTSNKDYTMKNQGRIYMNNITMVYPSDIKVDYNDTLWIMSNKMPLWTHRGLDMTEVNFRIFSAPVLEAISHTACDITPRSDILDKFINKFKNVTSKTAPNDPSSATRSTLPPMSVSFLLLLSYMIRF